MSDSPRRVIKGTVVVTMKDEYESKSFTSRQGNTHGLAIDATGPISSDAFRSIILGLSASLQLISATKKDDNGNGKVGNSAHVQGVFGDWPPLGGKEYTFITYFDYDKNFGTPGAFYIKNLMKTEFFLVSLTLEGVPGDGTIHFVCNSWICDAKTYPGHDRIFFANKTYLPSQTPAPLVNYRTLELKTLRGDGKGERKKGERIYDYDFYNDLGDPDHGKSRPIAGGSKDYPYPRRGRTGRKPTTTDPHSESKSNYVYIPRDEDVVDLEFSKNLVHRLNSVAQDVTHRLQSASDTPENEFDSFDDVFNLYSDQGGPFPVPKVIQVDKNAWITDEEFAREITAGVNPGLIRCLQEFPPKSKLDSKVYGDHTSTITKKQIHHNLDGLSVDEAIQNKKLFLLDHHDTIFPYLRKINSTPTTKAYASRTILFLQNDGTLKPLAIELSLPRSQDYFGAESIVYLPKTYDVESLEWKLAKAYVIVNDACFHQLISHWLNTHAVVEPFVIATNRQLSVVHPIYKLLHPHFRNTMNINAAARNVLVNADGVIETTFLWGKYCVEMSSEIYKDWVFPEQALPADLKKRGMAVEDANSPHGLRLAIEDYPYAVDGLDIWDAIKKWVQEYVSIYYTSDGTVQQDTELKSWWEEVVEKGHGDKKDEKWWPKMQTREELIQTCIIIIWTASALHAAVNFGQYPYGGFILNRPTLSRQLMPKKGTTYYHELENNFEKAYLKTITPRSSALVDLKVLEVLSTHSSDEYYLGQRDNAECWTSDTKAKDAFKNFGDNLAEIEEKIIKRNEDKTLKNRVGPVSMPYTLLYPSSEEGITFRGIPNSISI